MTTLAHDKIEILDNPEAGHGGISCILTAFSPSLYYDTIDIHVLLLCYYDDIDPNATFSVTAWDDRGLPRSAGPWLRSI